LTPGTVRRVVVVKAREIMHTDVLTVDPTVSALDCARRMTEAHKGYAVLLREGRMVGIVTEWDFLAKLVAHGVDPATTPVSTLASSPVAFCDADTPTDEVVERMAREEIRRMVVTQSGRVVGMITSKDVIKAFKPYIDKISADISGFQPSLT
jgi:CBS domain-containing protein